MIKLALSTLMADPVDIWVDITGGRAAIGDAAAKSLGLPVSGLKLVAGGHELSTPEGLAAALRTRQIRAVPRQMAAPIGKATADIVLGPDDIKAFFDSLGSEAPAAFDLAAAAAARGAAGRPEASSAPDSGAQRRAPMVPPGADAPIEARRRYAEMCDRQKAAAAAAATARGENIQMRRRIEALRDRKDARRAARARKRAGAGAKAVRRGASSPAAPPVVGFAGFAPGFLEVKQRAKAPRVKTALGPAKTSTGTFAGLRAGFLN